MAPKKKQNKSKSKPKVNDFSSPRQVKMPYTYRGRNQYAVVFSGVFTREGVRKYFQKKSDEVAKIDPQSDISIVLTYRDEEGRRQYRSGDRTLAGEEISLYEFNPEYEIGEEDMGDIVEVQFQFTTPNKKKRK